MHLSIQPQPGKKHPLVSCDEEGQVLKNFLESELQQVTTFAEYLLENIEKGSFEISGNSYNLVVADGKFQIANLFDEAEHISGTLSFFTDILKDWISAQKKM